MDDATLKIGRHIFGTDLNSYINSRPEYPDRVYSTLATRCGLRPGVSVLEIGAGSGLATKRLLSMGVSHLRAIEPDPVFAAFLREALPTTALRVDPCTFEDCGPYEETFDLAVSATAFHWLEQSPALLKLQRILKPGGWFAMWWNHFGTDTGDDAFEAATDHLFSPLSQTPAAEKNAVPFALNHERRLQDLRDAGFQHAVAESWHWDCRYETARLVQLYNSFSPVRVLETGRRRQILHELTRIIDEQFGGIVQRIFTTALYTGQRAFE
jgi:SAM-dependent methyltransferase